MELNQEIIKDTRQTLEYIANGVIQHKRNIPIPEMREEFRNLFQRTFYRPDYKLHICSISTYRALTDLRQENLLGDDSEQIKDYRDSLYELFDLEFKQWRREELFKD